MNKYMIEAKNIETNLCEYSFNIPKELIAQKPLEQRESSRLLVLDRGTKELKHENFSNIPDYLNRGDCLVLNTTKVLPARVFGKKETGGKIEVLFLDSNFEKNNGEYSVLLKPFVPPGKKIYFENNVSALVLQHFPLGETLIKLEEATAEELFERYGVMPLPPYIKREKTQCLSELDKERYQTVYAKEKGSIAAPTAGLHFTEKLLSQIREKGVKISEIVLHVGRGTFRPIVSKNITEHKMLPEYFEITEDAARTINETIQSGSKVVACGTTSVRAMESSAIEIEGNYLVKENKAFTEKFIYPGYSFKIVSSMVTNLHLPQSTPLMMACAFAGRENILNAYEKAIKLKYRFFSYGDAMFII